MQSHWSVEEKITGMDLLLITLNGGGSEGYGWVERLTKDPDRFWATVSSPAWQRTDDVRFGTDSSHNVVASGTIPPDEVYDTDHIPVWYHISTSKTLPSPSTVYSLVVFCFQEAKIIEPVRPDNFLGLPFIFDTYSFGSGGEYRGKPAGFRVAAHKGVRLLVFGDSRCIGQQFLQEVIECKEVREDVSLYNNDGGEVFVERIKKSPEGWLHRFEELFKIEKFYRYRQTHVCALGFPVVLSGNSFGSIFGAHCSFTAKDLYPAAVDADVRLHQMREVLSRLHVANNNDNFLLLYGDLNMRTNPTSYMPWQGKAEEVLTKEFHANDWPLGVDHAAWPNMFPIDWTPGEHTKIWAQSQLWKNSEGSTNTFFDNPDLQRKCNVLVPNFPPTYPCTCGQVKKYVLCKRAANGTITDVRTPSWTEQLIVLQK